MDNNNDQFWQFSDQLRVHTPNLANLSLNDNSIWSTSYASSAKKADLRRNFDIRVGGELLNTSTNAKSQSQTTTTTTFSNASLLPNNLNLNQSLVSPDYNNGFNDAWKIASSLGISSHKNLGVNGEFNKGIYSSNSKPSFNTVIKNQNNSNSINLNNSKGYNKNKGDDVYGGGKGVNKKNNNSNGKHGYNNNTGTGSNDHKEKNSLDKRFKTLPPSESLPRDETVGGYIFVCNNDTMQENLQRQLFGLPPRYRDSVRAITPGLPLFLYNYSTHQLHGVFEAASFGGTNIDPTAWEDKKCPGESRFPAQVRVVTRKVGEPLEEDSFRPVLHHYDGPKFRLELNIPEALSLLDIFEEGNA